MSDKPKRPKGWYSKDAKERRKAAREERRKERRRLEEASRLSRRVKAGRQAKVAETERGRAARSAANINALLPVSSERDRVRKKAERELRKELMPKKQDDNPYLRRQHRVTSIIKLYNDKKITPEMDQAIKEIETVYLALTKGMMAKGMPVEPPTGKAVVDMSDHVSWIHRNRYKPWADEIAKMRLRTGRNDLAVIIDVVIDRRFCTTVEHDHHLAAGLAELIVRRSLTRYAELGGWLKAGSTAEFDRAHPRLWPRRLKGIIVVETSQHVWRDGVCARCDAWSGYKGPCETRRERAEAGLAGKLWLKSAAGEVEIGRIDLPGPVIAVNYPFLADGHALAKKFASAEVVELGAGPARPR